MKKMLVILVMSSISTLLNLNLSRAFPNRMRMSTSNNGSFLIKNNENTYPKGRALIHMYIVVPQTK